MDLSILSLLAQATLVAKAVLVVLLFMSVFSWALMFRKWMNIRAALKKAADGMDRFNHARDLREAVQSLGGDPDSPLYTVAHEGVTEFNRSKEAGNSEDVVVDNVRRALRQGVDMEMTRLTSSLSFLATSANTAPFIGLFGTVWGRSTSSPSVIIGAVTMKMMSRTSMTSTNGVTLISDTNPLLPPTEDPMRHLYSACPLLDTARWAFSSRWTRLRNMPAKLTRRVSSTPRLPWNVL